MQFHVVDPNTIGHAGYLADALQWVGLRNIYDHEPRTYVIPDPETGRVRRPGLLVYRPKLWIDAARRVPARSPGEAGATSTRVSPGDDLTRCGASLVDALEAGV